MYRSTCTAPTISYTHTHMDTGAVSLAESHLDFVVGVVSRGRVSDQPQLVHMTPGN